MALTNEQYDKIAREYEELRARNLALQEERTARIERRVPELRALENRIASLSVQRAKRLLAGENEEAAQLAQEVESARARSRELLAGAGFSESELLPVYDCLDCRDTGYRMRPDGTREKCHCFRERELALLYDQSNIRNVLGRNNFSSLTLEHLSGEDRTRFQGAVDICLDFVQNFDSDYRNLLFYGTVGTGKSFLSCCISAKLLETGHSVIYMSAQNLFDSLADNAFRQTDAESRRDFGDRILECDLLVIDDLGSELDNNFVSTQIFTLINERFLRRRSILLSTNLSLSEIDTRYSKRVSSRLAGSYELIGLTGPDARIALGLGAREGCH